MIEGIAKAQRRYEEPEASSDAQVRSDIIPVVRLRSRGPSS
jgi:hypothetical protein